MSLFKHRSGWPVVALVLLFGVIVVGCNPDSTSTLPDPPEAVFTASPRTGDAPLVVEFDASESTGEALSYSWAFGDGETGSGVDVEHEYATAGDYTVTLTVEDAGGETDTATTQITASASDVPTPPEASFTASPEMGEAPLTVAFDASNSTGTDVTYAWQFGDDETGTGVSVEHEYGSAGEYTVTLTVEDARGETDVVSRQIRASAPMVVAAGYHHAYALDASRNLHVWGHNRTGQLGNGNDEDQFAPETVTLPDDVTFETIVGGGWHGLALDEDGNAWAWGDNEYDVLGVGDEDLYVLEPMPVLTTSPVTFGRIDAGGYHSIALDEGGQVWTWGDNSNYQLGNNTDDRETRPIHVSIPGVTFTDVAAGQLHSLALDASGTAWAWGWATYGQLGNDTDAWQSAVPETVTMPDGVDFVAVDAGRAHSMALDENGNVWTWGSNEYGQLGLGDDSGVLESGIPVAVNTPDDVAFTAIAAGYLYSLALDEDGNVWGWGLNSPGRLGDGTDENYQYAPVQADMPEGVTFASIDAGFGFSIAHDTLGNVWTWGDNQDGQLGVGADTSTSNTPVRVTLP